MVNKLRHQISQSDLRVGDSSLLTARIKLFLSYLFFTIICVTQANAHEIRPAIVEINYSNNVTSSGGNDLQLELLVNLESLLADIGPDHTDTDESDNSTLYAEYRAFETAQLLKEFQSFQAKFISKIQVRNALGTNIALSFKSITIPPIGDVNIPRDTRITLNTSLSEREAAITWQWSREFGEAIVRANSDVATVDFAALLSPGQQSDLIHFTKASEQTSWQALANYIVVGFEHIIPKGLDHILFVVGLFLLAPIWRPLAIQVTVFTIAHSITLALAVNGYVSISAAIVEPLIALSIVFVCAENYFSSGLSKWRISVVFIFGLLHGLGFASVLGAVGLDNSNFLIALLGFNIGVELGQLSIIAICMLGVGIWFGKHDSYRKWFSKPASIIVGSIGLFWFLQRIGIV